MSTRLANFQLPSGSAQAGMVRDGKVFPIGMSGTLQQFYDDPQALDRVLAGSTAQEGLAIADVRLLPPSLEPSAIYFAGFNYHDHVNNMEKAFNIVVQSDPKGFGLKPWHGQKPRNALSAHGDHIELPTDHVDWEVELAVVIGRPARRVPVAEALGYVAGYTVAVDMSARDLSQRPHTPDGSPARFDWIMQKGLQGFCPLGPWLTPSRDIADPQKLDLKLSVNGVVKQDSNTREMIYSVAEAIAHLSDMVTLSPGDIILTGTPAGTGAESGEFLKPGDEITAWIESIGELKVGTRPWEASRFY